MEKLLECQLFDLYGLKEDPSKILVPLFSTPIAAGFPSPAEDWMEEKIDLNEYLIKNPSATFLARAKGISMMAGESLGIQEGDLLIVDRSLPVKTGGLCICILNGEFTVKRIRADKKTVYLVPDNPSFPEIQVLDGMDFDLWGMVSHVIHKTY